MHFNSEIYLKTALFSVQWCNGLSQITLSVFLCLAYMMQCIELRETWSCVGFCLWMMISLNVVYQSKVFWMRNYCFNALKIVLHLILDRVCELIYFISVFLLFLSWSGPSRSRPGPLRRKPPLCGLNRSSQQQQQQLWPEQNVTTFLTRVALVPPGIQSVRYLRSL